jgi:hypothetical protein
VALCALAGLALALAGTALGDPGASAGPEADAAARARGEKLRAALPAPSPTTSIDFQGDVVIDGLWAGEMHCTLRVARLGNQSVWRVSERTFLDYQGTETQTNTILHLDRELGVVSGSSERRVGDTTVTLAITRTPQGFLIQRRRKVGEDWKPSDVIEMKAPRGTTHGLAALVLLLRAMPERSEDFALPRVDSWPYEGTPADVDIVLIRALGPSRFEHGKEPRASWAASMRSETAAPMRLHLTADRKAVLGGRRVQGEVTLDIVPRGEGGRRERLAEAEPARTWKAAFLKFGYGYHMAQRDLLAQAFHWDRMYEHETTVLSRWPKERPLTEFRKAWIDEFCAQSLRRSELETRRLLDMTLATGKVRKKTKDTVVFAAHANFGGGTQRTYHLERRDGVWGIVRVDF